MVIRSLAAVALSLVIVLLLVLIALAAYLLPTAAQVGGGIQGLTSAPDRLTHGLGVRSAELLQDVADLVDPAHPPRQALRHDVEFDAWNRIPVGGVVATSGMHHVTLVEVRRREDATSGDYVSYAVVRQRMDAPRVIRIFDAPIRVERGEVSHVLFKGESFQVGEAAYKVNWVSRETGEIAVAQYRRRQDVPGALKFVLP
jgi:hypothetical protein